jgi:hypothetical protein
VLSCAGNVLLIAIEDLVLIINLHYPNKTIGGNP